MENNAIAVSPSWVIGRTLRVAGGAPGCRHSSVLDGVNENLSLRGVDEAERIQEHRVVGTGAEGRP